MKNFVKWLGLIAFAAIIGVSLAACNKVKLEGTTWEQSDGSDDCLLIFNSPPNMIFVDNWASPSIREEVKGTYTISGNKVTITIEEETLTGKVSGNKLSLGVITLTKRE